MLHNEKDTFEQLILRTSEYLGVKAEIVESSKYHFLKKQRDGEARLDFLKELENDDLDGIYIRDIMREEWKNDDQRLR